VIANFAATHQWCSNPHGVASESITPVNAEAVAAGASRCMSRWWAIPTAATVRAGS
jgi:hypothetical protein